MLVEFYKRRIRHLKHSCISDSVFFLQVLNIGPIVFAHRFAGNIIIGGFNESSSRKVLACYSFIQSDFLYLVNLLVYENDYSLTIRVFCLWLVCLEVP